MKLSKEMKEVVKNKIKEAEKTKALKEIGELKKDKQIKALCKKYNEFRKKDHKIHLKMREIEEKINNSIKSDKISHYLEGEGIRLNLNIYGSNGLNTKYNEIVVALELEQNTEDFLTKLNELVERMI